MACRSKFSPDSVSVLVGALSRGLCGAFAALIFVLFMPMWTGCGGGWVARHPLARDPGSSDVVGRMQTHRIRGDETLLDLTRPYDLGYVELVAANPGIDPWLPGPGTRIVLPTAHLVPDGAREGIVINLAEQRLYLFGESTLSFPIGVSREGWTTPLGATRVVRKREHPSWYPTASARREDPTLPRVVHAGPENPLGTHALYLGWPRYLIHGTNEPDGVGRRVSRGCIRLYPEDIVRLFEATTLDMPVRVIHEPVKLARVGADIFLEVHPTLDEMLELETTGRLEAIELPDLQPRIRAFAGELLARIDWTLAYQTAEQRRGVPVRITR